MNPELEVEGVVAAVLGLNSAVPLLSKYAPKVTCPVLYLQNLDDTFMTREASLALFDQLGSTDKRIHDYVMGQPETADFMQRLDTLLDGLVPGFLHEGKRYLTIAIGCTGGRYRRWRRTRPC